MKFGTALAWAIAAHAVLAALLGVCLTVSPNPVTLAQLDVTSVELSFAEDESDTAPVAPVLPLPPPEPPTPREEIPEPEREPLPKTLPALLPPEPDAVKLPEPPTEQAPKLDLPKKPPEKKSEPKRVAEVPAPVPPVAPRQAKVDAPPSPRKAIKPDYPRGARQRGEEGDVVVELRVTARGTVERVSIVTSSGFPELDDAALRAVKSARFTPAKRGDTSVPSTARMTLTFRLKN